MLPRPNSAVIFEPVDGGGVLFSTADELYFGLNDVGARVWRAIVEGAPDLDAVVHVVLADFPDAPGADDVRADVEELLADLVASRLLHAAPTTAPTSTPMMAGLTAAGALRLAPSPG